MNDLNRYRIPAIGVAGVVVVFLILWLAWLSPEGSKVSSLDGQKATLQAQVNQLQQTVAHDKALQQNFGTACTKLAGALEKIPYGQANVSPFFQEVTNLATASGDPNTPSISITSSQTSSGADQPVGISLSLSGTYSQLETFIKGIDGLKRLFIVTAVNVTQPSQAGGSSGGSSTSSANSSTATVTGSIYSTSTKPPKACSKYISIPASQ